MKEGRGVVVGTAGHVDHGKTALVRALTGVETDRWREERERGLTIDIGFARLPLADDLEVGVIDVPGHEDFLKNMLAGATGIDVVLLVVAADEGAMPQTLEHLAIADLLDVGHGVVALTKRDRVEPDWLELVRETTRELLSEGSQERDWPIVSVSATTGEGLEDLRDALRIVVDRVEGRAEEDLFRLPVDRAFSVHGTGTVVTGTVWSGSIERGQRVRLLPESLDARVRGLEVHGEARDRVGPGRRCAVALVGPATSSARRGSTLVRDDAWRPADRLGVRLDVLSRPGRPIEHGQRVRVYLGTREVMAQARLPGRATLAPGTAGWGVLALEQPLVARARDRAIVRFYSPVTTIGGARIAEIDPPGSWERRLNAWGEILSQDTSSAFDAVVGLAGTRGLPVAAAPLAVGRPAARIVDAARDRGALRIEDAWFSARAAERAAERIESALADLHGADRRAAGVSKEAVRSALSDGMASALLERTLNELIEQGRILESGPRVALPGHRPELTPEEAEAKDRLEREIVSAGLTPPLLSELARSLRIARPVLDDLLRLLREEGAIRAVTPELHVSAEALDAMEVRVRQLLADAEPAAPTVFKEAFDLSRKYLIPLLEHLDREGVTRRTGEGRTLTSSGH